MRFDLVSLSLFVAVIEEKSIARAAEREHIAPSALSKRLTDMEQLLGSELFVRRYRGIEPTELARAMLPKVRGILRDLIEMKQMAESGRRGVTGLVRICATMAATCQYLPNELAEFLATYPGISIDLEEEVSRLVADAVQTGAADIGILVASRPLPGLTLYPYHSDELALLVPFDHPLAGRESIRFGEALGYEMVGPKKGSSLETLLTEAAEALGKTLVARMRISAFDTLFRMVEAGLGIAVAPRRYLRGTENVVPIVLDEPWATRQLCLCVKDPDHVPPAARMLIASLRAN